MSHPRRLGLAAALVALLLAPAAFGDAPSWSFTREGELRVRLLFFWSEGCPHCHEAMPFVESLEGEYPWLAVESYELRGSPDNRDRYRQVAESLGVAGGYVPAFAFCGQWRAGYAGPETSGEALRRDLLECRRRLVSAGAPPESAEPERLSVPLLGTVDPRSGSLLVYTLLLGGLDAFNPCAFFVLLFLLSLMVHARSRARIAVVGGVFVFFSGLLYFVFMAAWLNVFLFFEELRAVTAVAGCLALLLGGVNVKDYFAWGRGVSLSIPERAKPGLFRRMRGLVAADRWPALLAGTVLLALAANSYELLCTAGLPLVFTRILTLAELPAPAYYGYIALYNVMYVVPLAAVVVVFAWKLGSRKLGEREGRVLKLLSGTLMASLGAVLLLAPDALQNLLTALGLMAGALGVTALVVWLTPGGPGSKPAEPAKPSDLA